MKKHLSEMSVDEEDNLNVAYLIDQKIYLIGIWIKIDDTIRENNEH